MVIVPLSAVIAAMVPTMPPAERSSAGFCTITKYAVSYTHLDVYKRQLVFYGKTGRGKTHLATALGMLAIEQGRSVRFRQTAELVPVSYTHLDVYKRQILISPMLCRLFH